MMIGNLTGNESDVCVIFNRNGAYIDTFTNTDAGVAYAKANHGSYLIVRPTQITERVKQANAYSDSSFHMYFEDLFAKFFPIFRGDAKE